MTPPDQIGSSLWRFVWRHAASDQIGILIVTLAGMPLLYLTLELPKQIINDAINGTSFPRDVLGHSFGQIEYLVLLCVLFFTTVVAHNGVKWLTNVSAGITGERMLRRLRFRIFEQTLRFPPPRLAATRPAEVVQTMMAEIEPLGGFFGEVVATPMSQGGMLLVFVGFIFVQDPLLGLAATGLLPVQAVLIPMLQRRVVLLNRERAQNNRRLADTVASTLDGQADVRVHGTQRWHLAQVSARLHTNTQVRKALFLRKFTIKTVGNLMNQVTPFLFFLIGGAMVIEGRLDLGALVAVLSAYKEIGKPWRELLSFYQRWSDFRSRFALVAESFSGSDLTAAERLNAAPAERLGGPLELTGLAIEVDHQPLALPSLAIAPGTVMALTGGDAANRLALLRAAVGVEAAQGGEAALGGRDLAALTPADLGAAVGVVSASPMLLNASLASNMAYGVFRHAPPLDRAATVDSGVRLEARRTGAPPFDAHGDWIDYAAAGCRDATAFRARMVAACEAAGMGNDLLAAALSTPIGSPCLEGLRSTLLAARAPVAEALAGLGDLVEPFDRAAVGAHMPLLESMLFAVPTKAGTATVTLLDDPTVARLLARHGGEALLADIGADLARNFARLTAAVSTDSPLLDRMGSFGRSDVLLAAGLAPDLPEHGRALRPGRVRKQLVALAARYLPVRDRLEVMSDDRRAALLAVRQAMAPRVAASTILTPLDAAQPPASLTLAEVLLRGNRREDRRAGWRRLDAALAEALGQAGLRERLLAVGLDAPVGPTPGQAMRERISLVRTILKRPRLVLLEGAGPQADLAALQLLRRLVPDAIVLVSTDEPAILDAADTVARIDQAAHRIALEKAA